MLARLRRRRPIRSVATPCTCREARDSTTRPLCEAAVALFSRLALLLHLQAHDFELQAQLLRALALHFQALALSL